MSTSTGAGDGGRPTPPGPAPRVPRAGGLRSRLRPGRVRRGRAPRAGGLTRGRAVVLVLLVGVALLGSTLGTWVSAPVSTAIAADVVRVPGSDAAPVIPSAGLVVLAAGLAIGLSGRVVRILAAVAVALGGALSAFAAVELVRHPVRVAESAAGDVTGVRALDGVVSLTPWPYVAIVLGLVALALGVALPFLMGRWALVGRRYEREPGAAADGGGAPSPGRSVAGSRVEHVRAMDDWDALSRGEDPTERPGR
ncbi:MAG: Trp biosynthesis-associated membrane protein [Actinomycetales bacterium]|nr:Trp biosynthesis-associated membrane protein [Actinomycetales bacterium]